VVALEQLDHVEAGDDLVAVRLQAVPLVGCAALPPSVRLPADDESEGGGAWEEMLHADST
jgi:hypothetical protein